MAKGKAERLRDEMTSYGSVLIAFSGGVDSSVVAAVAEGALGRKALAAMVVTELISADEVESARETAREIGISLEIVPLTVLGDVAFLENPPNRCYLCKRLIFTALDKVRADHSLAFLVDGTNADDARSDRPGLRAIRDMRVKSPLAIAGLGKKDVRRLAAKLGLSVAEKPANPCLATRIPFGDSVDAEKLRQVDEAERAIRRLGFAEVRVRHHGSIARIEVSPEDVPRLLKKRRQVIEAGKRAGFAYVDVDLEGYRSGSMEEVLR